MGMGHPRYALPPPARCAWACALPSGLLVFSGAVHLSVCGTGSGALGSARTELASFDGGALHPPCLPTRPWPRMGRRPAAGEPLSPSPARSLRRTACSADCALNNSGLSAVRLTLRRPHGLPTRAQVLAALRRWSGGCRAGMPPSLDPARSAPSLPDPCRAFDAVARADSAVWLSGGLQVVVRASAGRPRRRSGVTAELLGGNVAPAGT